MRTEKTRDQIISILGKNWPLSAKTIHKNLIEKGNVITYQATHKMCKDLLEKNVLEKESGKYLLNSKWIENKKDFFDKLSAKYSINRGNLDLESLKNIQMKQMTKKGILPKDEKEAIYHLMEELGEFSESIRERHTKEEIEEEIADILWQLNKICWLRETNLEKAFLKKLYKNRKR